MTRRVNLPRGGWADLKEPDKGELSNGDRRTMLLHVESVRRATQSKMDALGITPDMAGAPVPPDLQARYNEMMTVDDELAMNDAQGALIVTYVAAWSKNGTDLEPPLTLESIAGNAMPPDIFDLLAVETNRAGTGDVDTSVDVDPASPTGPSAA